MNLSHAWRVLRAATLLRQALRNLRGEISVDYRKASPELNALLPTAGVPFAAQNAENAPLVRAFSHIIWYVNISRAWF